MTNNKQQSAVDLIYQRMSDKIVMQDVNKGLICIHISHDDFIKLAKQAKEMEKEQIVDAWISDRQFIIWSGDKDDITDDEINELANDYYNETYRGDN